jgi:hypothetical protein
VFICVHLWLFFSEMRLSEERIDDIVPLAGAEPSIRHVRLGARLIMSCRWPAPSQPLVT